MREQIAQMLEHLPPVPDVVHKLQDLYYLDAYNAKDIEDIIKQDPNLVADILRIANSPLYEFSREIVDIRQAIVLFGLEKVIEFALASFVEGLGHIDLSLYGIDERQFLTSAKHKSEVAQKLVRNKKDRLLASNTAFLADVSKVIIAQFAHQKGLELPVKPTMVFNEVDDIERECLGFDSIEISAMMFEKWHFDPAMVDLLRSFKERADEVQRALFGARDVVQLGGEIQSDRLESLQDNLAL